MRLRNKKTGEIIETDFGLSISIPDDEKLYGCDTYTQLKGYTSLAELNKEWEDASEEPKEHWYLDSIGKPIKKVFGDDDFIQTLEAIGNYFETKEEAEKAVEKLKAWKRLKDKRVKFYGWRRNQTGTYDLLVRWEDRIPRSYEVKKDLDLLFGGEE